LSLLRCKKLDYIPADETHHKGPAFVRFVHPEMEEKPVVQAITASSEDVHGGDESTSSIPFSPSASTQPAVEQREGTGQTRERGPEGVEEVNKPGDGTIDDERREEFAAVPEDDEDAEDDFLGVGDEDGLEGEEERIAGDGDEEGDGDGSEAPDEGGAYVGEYNTEQAVKLGGHTTSLFLTTEFYRLLELLMEERTKVFDSRGMEEYNVRKLILRPYEKKPLSHYIQARVKESIVVLLDNSGSMDWWAEELQLLASIALARKDVELYAVPNGTIQTRLTNRGYVPVDHAEVIKKLQGRRIVYVGDFDGANTPVELSWSNDVIWICPEMRYRRFKSHDWVDYTEEDFKGVFIRAWTLEEVFSALRKVDRFYNLWIDFHEDHSFYDDEVAGD
jgi:hypothetical protein